MFQKTIPHFKEYQSQKAALLYFQGPHMVRLLSFDDQNHILNLEWVSKQSLRDFFPGRDNEAIQISCELMKSLHHAHLQQTDFSFPHLRDWCAWLDKPFGLPPDLIDQAKTLAKQLIATTTTEVLLHGDLHHDNILLKDAKAIAIDPKAVWGDPLFEPARFILNPIDCILDEPDLTGILQNRIQQFELYFNDHSHRIRDWTFVCAMIAASWNCEDGFSPDAWVKLARVLTV